jgi:hypothetical protein
MYLSVRNSSTVMPYLGMNWKDGNGLAELLADSKLTPDFGLQIHKVGELASFLMWMMAYLTRAGALLSQQSLVDLKIAFKAAIISNRAKESTMGQEIVLNYVNSLSFSVKSVLKLFFGHLKIVIRGYQSTLEKIIGHQNNFEKTVDKVCRESVTQNLWPSGKGSVSASKIMSILIAKFEEINIEKDEQPRLRAPSTLNRALTRPISRQAHSTASRNNTTASRTNIVAKPLVPAPTTVNIAKTTSSVKIVVKSPSVIIPSLSNSAGVSPVSAAKIIPAQSAYPISTKSLTPRSPGKSAEGSTGPAVPKTSVKNQPSLTKNAILPAKNQTQSTPGKKIAIPRIPPPTKSPSKIPVQKAAPLPTTPTKNVEPSVAPINRAGSKAPTSPKKREVKVDNIALKAILEENEESTKKDALTTGGQQDSGTALYADVGYSDTAIQARLILVKNGGSPERGSPERAKNAPNAPDSKLDETAEKFKMIEHTREKTSSAKRISAAKCLELESGKSLTPVVLFGGCNNIVPSEEVGHKGEAVETEPHADKIELVGVDTTSQQTIVDLESDVSIQVETAQSKIKRQNTIRKELKSSVADLRREVQKLKGEYQTFEIKVDALPTNKTKKEIQKEIRICAADGLRNQVQVLKEDFTKFESLCDKLPKIETLERVLQFVEGVQRESEDEEHHVIGAELKISLASQLHQVSVKTYVCVEPEGWDDDKSGDSRVDGGTRVIDVCFGFK